MNSNGNPVDPFTGKPPQPPKGFNPAVDDTLKKVAQNDSYQSLAMINSMKEELAGILPARILEATFRGYLLTPIGGNWSFNSTSPWRVCERGVILYGYSDSDSEDKVWDLCGQDILSVSHQSAIVKSDPVFHLSSGQAIEIFSDWGDEPWVIQLPRMTFVASPSDHRYVD